MGHRGYGATWAIGPQRVWCTRGMGNGVQGYGVYRQWGTGGMGHPYYSAPCVYFEMPFWLLVVGHIANGAHGQWGLWAMGPMGNGTHGRMGDWDIFVYSIIITGWILTKILLDIDINVFYLNTPRFFHDSFI